jgi:hypothetical protein
MHVDAFGPNHGHQTFLDQQANGFTQGLPCHPQITSKVYLSGQPARVDPVLYPLAQDASGLKIDKLGAVRVDLRHETDAS